MTKATMAEFLDAVFASQRLAVLATTSGGQPRCCLVAFAESDDLKHLVFSTNRETAKYRELAAEPRVSMLVDSRSNLESDFRDATAVAAAGRAEEVHGSERERLLRLYVAKHPRLADFAGSIRNALVRVRVEEYVVATFQSVETFRPS